MLTLRSVKSSCTIKAGAREGLFIKQLSPSFQKISGQPTSLWRSIRDHFLTNYPGYQLNNQLSLAVQNSWRIGKGMHQRTNKKVWMNHGFLLAHEPQFNKLPDSWTTNEFTPWFILDHDGVTGVCGTRRHLNALWIDFCWTITMAWARREQNRCLHAFWAKVLIKIDLELTCIIRF